MMKAVHDFCMTQAARATRVVCDDRKQRSYCVNRPFLHTFSFCVANNIQFFVLIRCVGYVRSLTSCCLIWGWQKFSRKQNNGYDINCTLTVHRRGGVGQAQSEQNSQPIIHDGFYKNGKTGAIRCNKPFQYQLNINSSY